MTLNAEDFLWSQKYRPRKVADTILPDDLKAVFQKFVDQGQIPNMLLAGSAGVGKTTVAMAMCEEVGADYIVINGSMNGGVDTLRTEIQNFASTVSFNGGRKIVILDEADGLTPVTQRSLRNFMEEYSKNCGFILTCNFKNQIIAALHSRSAVIDFTIPKTARPQMAAQLMHRVEHILQSESVEYDRKAVAGVIAKYFPDFRRTINEIQRYSATGKIDTGILTSVSDESFKTLVELVKAKKWKEVRQWVGENIDNEPVQLMRKFYDQAFALIKPQSIPALVLLIAQYQYQSGFVADQEINLMAFLTQVMSDIEFV